MCPVTIGVDMPMRTPILRPTNHRPLTYRLFSRVRQLVLLSVSAALSLQSMPGYSQRQTIATRAERAIEATAAVDSGALPASQPLTLTLQLQPSPSQTVALDQLLAAQTDSSSPAFHQWLSPAEYAERFGASINDLAQLKAWLTAQGLSVTFVSPARNRLTVTGAAGQVQSTFAVSLRRMTADGSLYFANTAQPTVLSGIASLIATISGMDDLPSVASTRIFLGTGRESAGASASAHATSSPAAVTASLVRSPLTTSNDPLSDLATQIDANTAAVLTLTSTACLTDLSAAEIAEYRSLLRQANAQGITVIATSDCLAKGTSGSSLATTETPAFPAALGEVTAITLAPVPVPSVAVTAAETRPLWQAAPGLPVDSLRHEPDLTTASAAVFAQTITTLNQQVGHRVGNLNATLYSLAKAPGLFTQSTAIEGTASPPESAAGNWQASSGLGTIDLATLLKVYPHGISSTSVSLTSSSYAINYGDTFTLTAKVLPSSYASANPTGTITFTSSTQGVLGSASIDSSGTATLTPDVLPVGVYSVTASYSGDSNYSGGSSTSKVTITISIVNARLTATISPATNVPFGATATVTATVSLPGANAAPSGPVSAQVIGITGAVSSATLSPNPGGNTATANIVVSIPSPGNYTVQITCQGSTNYQCQTPVNLPITTVKGYTNTTVSVTPAAPQAGQPISLTATVANAGNGTGTYTYNGSVSFYDSGKLLATAPVATNQATTVQTLSGTRTHNIIAIYTGDSNWNTSTSGAVAVNPTILPDALTLASTVSGTNSLAGVNIIFTATTTTTITYGRGPTGTITFFDTFNGAVVQLGNPATLVANGPTASIGLFTTTGLLPGTHHIYAQYSGDDNYAPAISAVLNLSLSDFSVTMTPTSLSLAQGKSQQVTVFVGESGGFNGTVSLGCTPPSSSLATCNFAPASVTGGGATTLTIVTTATSATTSQTSRNTGSGLWPAGMGASVAALLLLVRPRRLRLLPSLLTILVAAGMLTANLGCGLGVTSTATSSSNAGSSSGATGSSANDGTPLGTQNFVITAAGTDGMNTIRHTYQYQVTVQ